MIREAIARGQRLIVFAGLRHSNFAREVTLLADAIALRGGQFGGIHHGLARGDVFAPRSVAALARDASFEKGLRRIRILGARDVLDSAGVTLEASGQDGPR